MLDRVSSSRELSLPLRQERTSVLNFLLSLEKVEQDANNHVEAENVANDVRRDEEDRVCRARLVAQGDVLADDAHSVEHHIRPRIPRHDDEQRDDRAGKVVEVEQGVDPLAPVQLLGSQQTGVAISFLPPKHTGAIFSDGDIAVGASVERALEELDAENAESHEGKHGEEETVEHHRKRGDDRLENDLGAFDAGQETERSQRFQKLRVVVEESDDGKNRHDAVDRVPQVREVGADGDFALAMDWR